jgi:hypothetical protein
MPPRPLVTLQLPTVLPAILHPLTVHLAIIFILLTAHLIDTTKMDIKLRYTTVERRKSLIKQMAETPTGLKLMNMLQLLLHIVTMYSHIGTNTATDKMTTAVTVSLLKCI